MVHILSQVRTISSKVGSHFTGSQFHSTLFTNTQLRVYMCRLLAAILITNRDDVNFAHLNELLLFQIFVNDITLFRYVVRIFSLRYRYSYSTLFRYR